MAHLWHFTDNAWLVDLLDELTPRRIHNGAMIDPLSGAAGAWAVTCDPAAGLRLNGVPLTTGLAVLTDRDELRLSGRLPLYFSTERLASVETYPATGSSGFCPRCKQEIVAGTPAVRCPACGLWHHASDALPCWTYAPTCAGCSNATAVDATFRWTPEDL